jgi:hypothetical protein
MNDLADAIDQLVKRMETLEGRVAELERAISPQLPRAESRASAPPGTLEAAVFRNSALAPAGSFFSVMGKAMLGIAGAYLLRAAEEAGFAPRPLVAIIGIVYALLWLVVAARAPVEARLARAVYSVNSAIILAPMLWELAIRFKVFPAPAIAAAIAAFELTAFFAASKPHRAIVLQIGNTAAAALALALAIATHETLPFLAIIILAAALCEYRSAIGLDRSARITVALSADLAAWLLLYIYSSPQSTRLDYPMLGTTALLAPGAALFLLYASAAAFKVLVKAQTISISDTAQTTITFLLAAAALLVFGPASSKTILGAVCIMLAAGCYAATLMLQSRKAAWRNIAVFSTWSGALLLTGSILCLPQTWAALWLSITALIAIATGARFNRVIFEIHGFVFLIAAAIYSGLAGYLGQSLFGVPAILPGPRILAVTACAALCFLASLLDCSDARTRLALRLLLAAPPVFALTALLAQGLAAVVELGMVPARHHLAFIRTLTLCAVSLSLVFGGTRLHRPELGRLGYAGIALIAVKLIAEDLRHGHLEYIAASIFLFALTLIAAPRLARVSQKA